jgi:hypothetical protein
MRAQQTSRYVYAGTCIRFLVDLQPGVFVYGSGKVLDNINSISNFLVEYGLNVTHKVLYEFWELKANWDVEYEGATDKEQLILTRQVTTQELEIVKREANAGRQTLLAESDLKFAYITTDKRHSINKLVNEIDTLFGRGVFKSLPELAKRDFMEAGTCIAFELPTSAAFNLMRGTEAVLNEFYLRIVKNKRIAQPRMWGPTTDHLRRLRKKPPEALLNNLDNIRKNYRNPTQHPEKSYDMEEAQDLLSLSADVVNQMIKYVALIEKI